MTKEELLQIPFYIEDTSGSANTVSITKNNTNSPKLTIEYSTDGSTWSTKIMNEDTTANTFELPANGKLYLHGENEELCSQQSSSYYNTITCSGRHNIGGNIMSLFYGSNFIDKTVFPTTRDFTLNSLFMNNTTLVNAQDLQLPVTTLTKWCYTNMFNGCSNLTTAPELPALTLDNQCYSYMFSGCSNLTTAPELPATKLASSCYQNMFFGCTNLTTAPSILPATTLTSNCYNTMFYGCSSLTTAPELPATTLASSCYTQMFFNCSKLNYIKANFINYDSSYFTNWVKGVSSTGTFVMNPEAGYNPEEIRGANGIPTGWNIGAKTYTDTHVYIINESNNLNALIINNNSSDLQYLVDMATEWVTLPTSKEPQRIEFQYGITLKGNNTSLNGCRIKTSKESTLNGNIMALLYGDDYEDKTLFPENSENTFKYLFLGYNKLTDISNLQLPATTLVPHCYQHMFTSCSSLKSILELPSIDLTDSCYHGMFMDCDSIDKVSLPEAYLAPYAYSNMFLGSDNLSDVTVTYKEDVDETNYKGWLKGVKTNGIFSYNHTEAVEENTIRNSYYVPETWDVSKN